MSLQTRLRVKRVYDPPSESDGMRILVDRIWPRGLTKQRAAVDLWLKEIASSAPLRTWFGHDPERWPEFRERYFGELLSNPGPIAQLVDLAGAGQVTLLFGAHDTDHNNAIALAEYLVSERGKATSGVGDPAPTSPASNT